MTSAKTENQNRNFLILLLLLKTEYMEIVLFYLLQYIQVIYVQIHAVIVVIDVLMMT